MDALTLSLVSLGAMLDLIALRVPIGIAMGAVPVALNGRIGNEVVQVCVMSQCGGIDCCCVVVHELAEEAERLELRLTP